MEGGKNPQLSRIAQVLTQRHSSLESMLTVSRRRIELQ